MSRTVAVFALVLTATSCTASSAADQRVTLCEDLAHLGPTIEVVVSPPPGVTVGDVRSALGKLESTFGEISRTDLIPEATRTELSEARLDYLDALSSTGDDDPIDGVRGMISAPARRLARDLGALETSLRCAALSASP
jgi:hypothetical protein